MSPIVGHGVRMRGKKDMSEMTGRQHLEWATRRAMEYHRNGDAKNAVASFMSDIMKHNGTLFIEGSFFLVTRMSERSSAEFEEFLLGFNVV